MRQTFTTPKGTELPLLNLRGKEYLQVAHRVVWFREEHPDWSIETEVLSVTESSAFTRATIKDHDGRVIATSHKYEDKKGFADFIEKSETGSIGRALALIGYGTQFCADELDEGARIVDSPHAPTAKPSLKDPGDYVVTFGKWGPKKDGTPGLKLKEIDIFELNQYVSYIQDEASEKGKEIKGQVANFLMAATKFLSSRDARQKQTESADTSWQQDDFDTCR